VIPAAGRGSRLFPRGSEAPKGLVDVGGRPLLLQLLERLRLSVSDVCIVVDDLEGPIRERIGTRQNGIRVHYVVQPEPLGVGDAVLRTHALVRSAFLVVMGDVYFDRPLNFFVDAWGRSGAEGAVLVEPVSGSANGPIGLVSIQADAVVEIWKAECSGQTQHRVCGAAILPEQAFETSPFLHGAHSCELELEDLIAWLIRERGNRFVPVTYGGWRQNINTPADLRRVTHYLEARG